jgi:beta-xylosidase
MPGEALGCAMNVFRRCASWADSFRPNAQAWFDRQMEALHDFDVTVTFCFTPEHLGIQPHHTSAPKRIEDFADFCARMIRRYGSTSHNQPQPAATLIQA